MQPQPAHPNKVAAAEQAAAALHDWKGFTPPLPEGIAMQQDTLLIFKPHRSADARYPSCFQSMSNNGKGKVYVHGLHVAVVPTRHMSIEELQRKIEELRRSLGPCSAPVQQQTRPPSCQYMRLACEALHAHWQRSSGSSTPPDESLMCYLLLHDIGARDSDLETYLHDSWATRLMYKALCSYDTETCAISNAGGVWASMRPLLEAVLPTALHRVDSDDSDDEDEDEHKDEHKDEVVTASEVLEWGQVLLECKN
jgi:hypothetical protein